MNLLLHIITLLLDLALNIRKLFILNNGGY